MTFSRFVIILGLLGVATTVLATPELVARLLSADRVLEPHTVHEVQAWRALIGLVSAAILVAALLWAFGGRTHWRRRIQADYAGWQDPLRHLALPDRVWMRRASAAIWLCVALALVTILLSFRHAGSDWFALLALESGVVETLQALCLLVAGVLLVRQGWRDLRSGWRPFSLVGLLFGVVLVVGAGEEISWGQHWLGFETPEELRAVNVQAEFNLHNIGSYWIDHFAALLFLVYIGLWPALGLVYPQLRYILDRLSMPLAPISLLPVVVIGTAMDEHAVIARLWHDPPWRLSEGRELLFSVSMLTITLLMRRYRARQSSSPQASRRSW